MFRFFVNSKEGNHFNLSKETLNHIKVARVEKEEFICIYDSIFYVCKLEGNKAMILKTIDENHEFENEVVIACSVIDFKRMEWLIQKATELGATKFIPMISQNVSQKFHNDKEKKIERWKTIAQNAAEQSFRNKVMEIAQVTSFEKVIELIIPNKYIAHEKVNGIAPTQLKQDCLILIGPEGGFSEQEIVKATEKSFEVITLGKRILRAETAAIYTLSKIV